MDVDSSELRKGLARTSRYLLSHHERSEWYRCYAPSVFGRRVHVCGRCLGIYPGVLAGLLVPLVFAGSFAPLGFSNPVWDVVVVAVLPMPALVDWFVTTFTDRRGSNLVRTATGALLGYGYGRGLVLLFGGGELWVLGVGVVYACLAGVLLASTLTEA